MSCLGQVACAGTRKTTKGAMRTNASAGRMWARVSAAWEAKKASRAASGGGAERGGNASAKIRRMTTATAMAVQIQKPMRSQSEDRCSFNNETGSVCVRSILRDTQKRDF